MTTMQRIKKWLEGSRLNHREAIALYSFIKGPYPNSHFACYMDADFLPDGIENQLVEIFYNWLSTQPEETLPKVSYVTSPEKVITPEPEVITQLRNRGKLLLKEQAFLHARLSAVESDEERFEIAKQLLDKKGVVGKIDRVYNGLREFEKSGDIPAIAASSSLKEKVLEQVKKRDSLKPRISRLRSKLKKDLSKEVRLKYEKELLEKEALLADIEKDLEL